METNTPINPVCSGVKEDIGDSTGSTTRVNAKSKYYVERVPDFGGRIKLPWFVFRREDDGDVIFVKDFKNEQQASAECKKLNGIWSLYHPDTPNPHKCCEGLWIPNKHTWEHAPGCAQKRKDLI